MRKPKYRTLAPLLLAQLASAAAGAAEPGLFAAPQATELPASGAGSLVQVTLALGLVVAAVFGAAWLMQRLRGMTGGNGGVIKVVTSVALGPKERAVLVQLGRQQLLLGVAPGRVNVLHTLAEPLESGQRAADGNQSGQPEAPNFKALLRKSLGLS